MSGPNTVIRRRGSVRGLVLVLAVGALTLSRLVLATQSNGMLIEDPGRLATEHFVHSFDPERVSRNGPTIVKTDYDSTYGLLRSTPPFVRETAFYMEEAVRAYESHGVSFAKLFADAYPARKRILVVYPSSADVPMQYVHDFGSINVRLKKEPDFSLALHRRRTAHEVFHAFQSKTIGGEKCTSHDGLWWVEATAEYAACDVVWPGLSKHKGNGRAYPYLLEASLTSSGKPTNDHNLDFEDWETGEEIEYDKGFFVQYLVENVLSGSPASASSRFFDVNHAVMTRYRGEAGRAGILHALDSFLVAHGPTGLDLAEVYRRFAAHHLLSAQSPLVDVDVKRARRSVPPTPLVGVVRTLSGHENDVDYLPAPTAGGQARPLEYTLHLWSLYSAQLWAIEAAPAPAGAAAIRQVRVTAVRLPSDGETRAQVFKGRHGLWLAGQPTPALTLSKSGENGRLSLSPGETLYVLTTTTSEAPDTVVKGSLASEFAFAPGIEATVRIEDVTPQPPPPAALPPPTSRPANPTPPASGHWKSVEVRTLKYELPGATSSISVSDGSITGKVTTHSSDEGPSTWAGSCSWTLQSPGGLGRLQPGARVDVSMTVTDTSVPEKVSGWNHGYVGVNGSIRFDRPYMALGSTHSSASDLASVSVGWTKSGSQKNTWTVPAGPVSAEWQGKAALNANCSFGRFERVYVWTTEPVVPASEPAAPTRPSFAGTWTGTWTNDVGERGNDTLVLEEAEDGTLQGLWSGNVPVSGRRVDGATAELRGSTTAREYEVQATLSGGVMTLQYVARRTKGSGSYRGTSTLARAK